MDSQPTLLLIEDNLGDRRLVENALAESEGEFRLIAVSHLEEALAYLRDKTPDLIITDLGLPDSTGMATFQRLAGVAESIPIVVLSGASDEDVAIEAVGCGAEDYFVKGDAALAVLPRVARHTIIRHRNRHSPAQAPPIDDLTQLPSLDGFLTLAARQMSLSRRTGLGGLMLVIRVAGGGGDSTDPAHLGQLVLRAADIVQGAMRSTDLIGRVGPDQVGALAVGTDQGAADVIIERVQQRVAHQNSFERGGAELSLSIGAVGLNAETNLPAAIAEAGWDMERRLVA